MISPEIVSTRKVQAARNGLPDPEVLREAAEVFRLLANPIRLALMHALTHEELTVGDIAHTLELSLSATSHQLALLRRRRLVTSWDQGRFTYYRATDAFVGHLVHDCLAHVGEALGLGARHHHPHRLPRHRRRTARPASHKGHR